MYNRLSAAVGVALLLAGAAPAAFAAEPALIPTNVPGIYSVAAPPAGFNALAASDADLERYGFPPRPDAFRSPAAYAAWAHAMTAWKIRITPVIRTTGRYHGPMQRRSGPTPSIAQGTAVTQVASSNWSGIADVNAVTSYGSTSYHEVEAEFPVPIAEQAFNACTGGYDYAANWVGIDGYNNDDVMQSGIGYDAYCSGNTTAQYYYSWIEWYPYAESEITNLTVSPGDVMYFEVVSTGDTTAKAIIINETTYTGGSIVFDAPPGTTLVGNSAEWILERPGVGGTLATLTNYVTTWFSSAEAKAVKGGFRAAGAPPSGTTLYDITMLDNSNSPISTAALLGTTAILFNDEGSAY